MANREQPKDRDANGKPAASGTQHHRSGPGDPGSRT